MAKLIGIAGAGNLQWCVQIHDQTDGKPIERRFCDNPADCIEAAKAALGTIISHQRSEMFFVTIGKIPKQ